MAKSFEEYHNSTLFNIGQMVFAKNEEIIGLKQAIAYIRDYEPKLADEAIEMFGIDMKGFL